MLNKNTNPVLTPNTHLWVAGGIGFITFFLFIIVWQFIVVYSLPEDWNKTLAMMISFFAVVPIPIFIFDRLVPVKCPKCGREMFGSSFRPPYKECKKCSYRYEYRIFREN